MAWASGTYTKGNAATGGWSGDTGAGIGIEPGRHDTQDNDFATGINNCLAKDGQNTPTANLPMGGYKHTGVANAANTSDYMAYGQIRNGAPLYMDTTNNRLGINTTAPLFQLDVSSASGGNTAVASVNQFSNDANLPHLFFLKTRGTSVGAHGIVQNGDGIGEIAFYASNGSSYNLAASIYAQVDGVPGASNDMPGRLVFTTAADNTSTALERMRIDNTGVVFVNTLNQFPGGFSTKMSIDAGSLNGGIGVVQSTASNTCINLQNSAGAGTRYLMAFYNATPTSVGNISHNGTNTTFNTSSDYRLKNDITPMTGGLAKLQLLKPSTWTWKESGEPGQGFIAHQLQEIIPDAVTGQKDEVDENGNPRYQGVDLSYLVATLTNAIQELNAKVESLEARIAALEA